MLRVVLLSEIIQDYSDNFEVDPSTVQIISIRKCEQLDAAHYMVPFAVIKDTCVIVNIKCTAQNSCSGDVLIDITNPPKESLSDYSTF